MERIRTDKLILDACCGSRMFWFNKNNPDVLFADIRNEDHVLCDGRDLRIHPDLIMDFTNMPFNDNTFQMVVMDPPHMKSLGKTSWMAKKYGVLNQCWETDLKKGVDESFRVLKPLGTLIFKWNEDQIKISKLLSVLNHNPLFGHTTGRHGKTIWLAFMKPLNN